MLISSFINLSTMYVQRINQDMGEGHVRDVGEGQASEVGGVRG
jgi:hypothetical protein